MSKFDTAEFENIISEDDDRWEPLTPVHCMSGLLKMDVLIAN